MQNGNFTEAGGARIEHAIGLVDPLLPDRGRDVRRTNLVQHRIERAASRQKSEAGGMSAQFRNVVGVVENSGIWQGRGEYDSLGHAKFVHRGNRSVNGLTELSLPSADNVHMDIVPSQLVA